MWDGQYDLGRSGKDLPCNTIATFQRGIEGELNLDVFCRSNDIIWGCYGANAVHFSFLLEYMALWIGCQVGVYRQHSINWHAYLDTLKTVETLSEKIDRANYLENPYTSQVRPAQMFHGSVEEADEQIKALLFFADTDFQYEPKSVNQEPFFFNATFVLCAHSVWRKTDGESRYLKSLELLKMADQQNDWVVAATQWIQRRYDKWKMQQVLAGDASHQ